MGQADLVLGLIGDDVKEEMLTEVAVTTDGPPVLIARTLRGGEAVRLILVRPGKDACMSCLALHKRDDHDDWIEIPDDDLEDVWDEGCAAASRPGVGVASEHAAVLAVAKAVDIIEGRELDHNQWLVVRQPIDGVDPRLSEPGTYELSFPPHEDCPWCSS